MERLREQPGPAAGDNGNGGSDLRVSMPRIRPLAIVDQYRGRARERHDMATSNTEGQ
jgi:hypothetical protein